MILDLVILISPDENIFVPREALIPNRLNSEEPATPVKIRDTGTEIWFKQDDTFD